MTGVIPLEALGLELDLYNQRLNILPISPTQTHLTIRNKTSKSLDAFNPLEKNPNFFLTRPRTQTLRTTKRIACGYASFRINP